MLWTRNVTSINSEIKYNPLFAESQGDDELNLAGYLLALSQAQTNFLTLERVFTILTSNSE